MVESLRNELRHDLESGRVLYRESTHVLSDLRHIARGGAIHIAVDFSEVYSLVFPNDSHTEMRLFFDDTPEDTLLLQHEALQRLFFRRDPVLIHPAHAIEFQTFIIKLRSGLFVDTITKLKNAASEWAAALDHPDATRLKQLGETVDTITDEDLDAAVRFFEENIASVLLIADERATQPLRVINRLVRERRFAEPEPFSPSGGSSHIKKRWQEALFRERGDGRDGASLIDSVVMAALHDANQRLAPNTRIHLVTRSPHMHQIFESELNLGYWSDAGGHVLRHPRIYSGLYWDDHEDLSERQRTLEKRRDSLRLLIRSAELYLQEESSAFDEEGVQRLRRAFREFRDDWRRLPKIDILADTDGGMVSTTGGTSRNAAARELLRAFAGNGKLADLMQQRLGELVSDIDRQHEFLGWLLQSNRQGDRRHIETLWMERATGDSTILMSRRHSMPYTLEFYSPELRDWADGFEIGRDVSWESIVGLFTDGLRDQNYERLLAMAYLLGSLDKWAVAEAYCQQAIHTAASESSSAHEAKFFLSICMRKHEATVERHLQALKILREAAENRTVHGGASRDPRYLREEALHILDLHRNHPASPTDTPAATYALALLQEALTLTDNLKLRVQLLNSICYYYCIDEFDVLELQAARNLLLTELRQLEPNESQWSPLVVDTIAWATHLLGADESTLQDVRRQLERALQSDDLRDIDKRILLSHLNQIRAAPASVLLSARSTGLTEIPTLPAGSPDSSSR